MRKPSILALILVLLGCIAGLEALNATVKHAQGIDAKDKSSLRALRYAPTIVAILIGFAWKALSSDLAMLMPWAAMSERWTPATDSILLNYVDSFDIETVYTALTRKHWALALVSACGLISGALVPLTNSLAYKDLQAQVQHARDLPMASKFVFDGSMALPMGWQSIQPWYDYLTFKGDSDAVSSLPFQTTLTAFESIDITSMSGAEINATVDSFSASLQCQPVEYKGQYRPSGANSSFVLEADAANCSLPVSQSVLWPWNSTNVNQTAKDDGSGIYNFAPLFWLNVTSCNSADDLRLLATGMVLQIPVNATGSGNRSTWDDDTIGIQTTGLMCTPRYRLTPSRVVIDGENGLINSADPFDDEAREFTDVGIGLDVIEALMNDPQDAVSQSIFEAAATNDWYPFALPNSYNWSLFPSLNVMQRYSYIYLYSSAGYSFPDTPVPATDMFFLTTFYQKADLAWSFFRNRTEFEGVVKDNFASFMTQLVSAGARAPTNSSVSTSISFAGERVKIRQAVVHLLQALLALLALVAAMAGFVLRPRTYLTRSPTSLEFMARMFAKSDTIDGHFTGISHLHQEDFKERFAGLYCRLQRSPGQEPILKLNKEPSNAALSPNAVGRYMRLDGFAVHDMLEHTEVPSGINKAARYRPFAIRAGSRIGIVSSLVGAIITAAILMAVSVKYGGFNDNSSITTAAWSFVPSAIIVIIGYSIQSMQRAALQLDTYKQLTKNTMRSYKAMARQQVQDVPHTLFKHLASTGTVLYIPCFVLLVTIPALKILAGNMFYQTSGYNTFTTPISVNVAPINTVNRVSTSVGNAVAEELALENADTISSLYSPEHPAWKYPDRIGPLNLPVIEQNLTTLFPDGDAKYEDFFEARFVALNTSISCTTSTPSDFGLFATDCLASDGDTLKYQCLTGDCKAKFGHGLSLVNVTTSVSSDVGTQPPYFSLIDPSITDDSVVVLIVDFSAINNGTFSPPASLCEKQQPLSSNDLGGFSPIISAVNCTRDLNVVRANMSFSRLNPTLTAGVVSVHSHDQQYDWLPSGYNAESIEFVEKAIPKSTPPSPLLIPNGGEVIYHEGTTFGYRLNPYSFMSLVTQLQEFRTGSQVGLLNVETLANATAQVYQDFTQNTLSQTLAQIHDHTLAGVSGGVPDSVYPKPKPTQVEVHVNLYKKIVKQDLGFTIALIMLVLVALVCVAFILLSVPRKTLLPAPPSSIAAQLAMLAGSRLVQRLRDEPESADIFRDRFGLGWWPATDDSSQMRWGIDTGELPGVLDRRKVHEEED